MAKDRIRLSDARALIAEGAATEAEILEKFDVEDDEEGGGAAPATSDVPAGGRSSESRQSPADRARARLASWGTSAGRVKERAAAGKPVVESGLRTGTAPEEVVITLGKIAKGLVKGTASLGGLAADAARNVMQGGLLNPAARQDPFKATRKVGEAVEEAAANLTPESLKGIEVGPGGDLGEFVGELAAPGPEVLGGLRAGAKAVKPIVPPAAFAPQIAKLNAARVASKTPRTGILFDLKRKLVDSTAPIQDLFDDVVKTQKLKIDPSGDIANSIDRVYRSPAMASLFIREHGLERVIREAPDLDVLDQFLIAKHAPEVEAAGFATGRDLALDAQEVAKVAATYDPIAASVTKYAQDLLDYTVDAGLVDATTAAALKAKYPVYVPIRRVMDAVDEVIDIGGKAVSSLGRQTFLRGLKGSTREIESPLESLVEKTAAAFRQGEKNKAARLLASYQGLPGNPFQLRVLQPGETAKHTISYLDGGTKVTLETTPEIARAAKSLDVQTLGTVGRILATPVRVARIGITGVNVPFLTANVAKDQVTALINSPRGVTTLLNPRVFASSLFESVGHGSLYDEMIREGALGTSFDMSRNALRDTVASIRSGRSTATRLAHIVRHPSQLLRTAEDLVARGEEFTRIQQYAAAKAEALAKGMAPEEARIFAARAARENSVNFARRGEWGSVLNSTFLYLNAGIQGSRTLLRNAAARPGQTGAKIALTVLTPVSVATAWNMSDPARKAAYDDIAEFEKDNNIILVPPVPVKDERGRYEVIKIPLAQQVNSLSMLPRRAIEQAMGSDRVVASDFAAALIGSVSPIGTSRGAIASTVIPQGAKLVAEPLLNEGRGYDLFTSREIVPEGASYRAALEETRTGPTSKAVAEMLGTSPLQVEHFVRASTGGAGQNVINAVDQALIRSGVLPPQAAGGESILAATSRRFTKATGGELKRKADRAKRGQ